MNLRSPTSGVRFGRALGLTLLAFGSSACSEGDAQKSWNALSTCLAGSAAQSPIATRTVQLRLIQLGSAGVAGKGAWPERCAGYADDLYAALGSASENALFRRKLHERMACGDNKGTCSPPTDSSLISVATELWEAAASSGLKTEAATGVPTPEAAAPPLINAASWKSFSDKPMKLVGPLLTPDGRGILLLKAAEGRTRPRGCEFSAGLSKVVCFDGHADVPELPAQTVDLVSDAQSVYAAGMTMQGDSQGLTAFDLRTGKASDVRGLGALHLVHDGLAVEQGGAKPSAPSAGAAPAAPKQAADDGFQVELISGGKAGKPRKLVAHSPLGNPLALGNQVVFLEPADGGNQLVAEALVGGRLKELTRAKGSFSGALHSCRRDAALAVAAFGPHAGQHGAKATAGDGKTQLTVALFQSGGWTKASEATIPFERGIESDLVCTKAGASLAYGQGVDGGVQVGRVDCDASGCKATDIKLPGIENKWWWAVGPVGDKLLVMWRSALGETRLRLAPLSSLPTTKDSVVFDAPDFGGPNSGELIPLYSDDGALLIFRDEQPVALHVAPEGTVRVVTP